MAKAKTPEAQLKKSIKAFCALHKVEIWSIMQGLGSTPGVADFLGIYKTKPIAIEAKAPKGQQSLAQKAFENRWTTAGGIYILARRLEDVAEGLGIKTLFGV